MAKPDSQPKKSSKQSKESSLKRWFTHGSGGHIVVILFIALVGIAFFIYAASKGMLEKYYYLIILLAIALVVQIILFIRIRRQH